MSVQRLKTDIERTIIKESKKFLNKSFKDLTKDEKDTLLELIAKKLGLLA
jgi:hypothetical protein